MVDESTGICGAADLGCALKGDEIQNDEWAPVRSASSRQIITEEQATNICNEYVDAYFAKTGRAAHQRNANLNNIVESVLDGCIDDLVLTGQIEVCTVD